MITTDQISLAEEEADKIEVGIHNKQNTIDLLKIDLDTDKKKLKIIREGIVRMKEKVGKLK
jgi:hypothetical protein